MKDSLRVASAQEESLRLLNDELIDKVSEGEFEGGKCTGRESPVAQ